MVSLDTLRHSAAHVLAMAVQKHYSKATLGIGCPIENGFYHDFDGIKITEENLKAIESSMKHIIKQNLPFKKEIVSKQKARRMFKSEPYKLELIKELPGSTVTIYWTGKDFANLCKGPHVKSTGEIKAFKLLRVAGAYWKGSEKNKMLTRIYGAAFDSKNKLNEFLKTLAEAESRDHIKLGKKLGLFVTSEAVGKGLPLLTPKGATIKRELMRFIQDEEIRRGYQYTDTPVLTKTDLYKISGHLAHYRDSMFIFKIDKNTELALRPMTCPHQFMIYKAFPHSYRELPIRYAELANLFRKEQSGELHGLIRIWQFMLADAHIICEPDQLEAEFKGVVNLIQYVMKTLGFTDFWYRFSKWDPKRKDKYAGTPKQWTASQSAMKRILDSMKLKYVEATGEAAFYGPKLDIQMKNVYGKEDTLFTVQVDFSSAEKFDMEYVGKDGKKHRPLIIHRASIGCIERTMALLIEKYAGAFPTWLAPIQAKVLNFTDRNLRYAKKVEEALRSEGIRVEVDYEPNTIQKKVRNAELERVPYTLVVGDKEQKAGTVAVRTRGKKKIDFGVKLSTFVKHVKKEIESRSIRP